MSSPCFLPLLLLSPSLLYLPPTFSSPTHYFQRAQLELESMKQKCDAWRDEVEKLAPLKDKVAHLQEENARLTEEITMAKEDNAGLGRQLQELSGNHGRQGELERKTAEYDTLMERMTELQRVRAQLENELVPLREERAAILTENAQLQEGSQPEKYTQLMSNYSSLSSRCIEMQKSLTQESELSKKLEEANRELQQQLHEATNEKNLQSIRERMERYRQERDQMKKQLQLQVEDYEKRAAKDEETITTLETALDNAAYPNQDPADEWQQRIESLTQKLEDYDARMRRYREERNGAKIVNTALQQQIVTLQSTIDELQRSQMQSSYETGQFDSVIGSASDTGEYSVERSSTSPQENQRNVYSPDKYSDGQSSHSGDGRSSELRKRVNRASSGKSQRNSSSIKAGKAQNVLEVPVNMKEGTVKMLVTKPTEKLNPRLRPAVVVKRNAGKYDKGTLVYCDFLEGKETAGVVLDCFSKQLDEYIIILIEIVYTGSMSLICVQQQ